MPDMAAADYVTLDNLKECETRFVEHMRARHGVTLPAGAARALRRTLHAVMKDVAAAHGADAALTVRDLHNLTLNRTREAMQRAGELAAAGPAAAPAGPDPRVNTVLQRGQDVFGHRTPVFSTLVPRSSSSSSAMDGGGAPLRVLDPGSVPPAPTSKEAALASALEAAQRERGGQQHPAPRPAAAAAAEEEPALSASELDARVRAMVDQRGRGDDEAAAQQPPPSPAAPVLRDTADLLQPARGTEDVLGVARGVLALQDAFQSAQRAATAASADDRPRGADALMPAPAATVVREARLALNGSDRDFAVHPLRNQFTIGAGLMNVYKDVAWLEATRIVVPMEVARPGPAATLSASEASLVQKPFYTNDVSLAFPYVTLMLQGLDGSYDGTNDALRRAFSVFVYDRSYKAPNGRGYVLMEPAQASRRVFDTPMPSLGALRVSLLRPNGGLINNASDQGAIVGVRYDRAEEQFLLLRCREYFDGNEFFVGDYVRIRDFAVARPASAQGDQAAQTAFAMFEDYINRDAGHEVVALGTPNDSGFYNSFNILVPGMLDAQAGRLVLDAPILDAILTFGAATDPATVATPGRLLNMSMQTVLLMSVGTRVPAPFDAVGAGGGADAGFAGFAGAALGGALLGGEGGQQQQQQRRALTASAAPGPDGSSPAS